MIIIKIIKISILIFFFLLLFLFILNTLTDHMKAKKLIVKNQYFNSIVYNRFNNKPVSWLYDHTREK